MFNPKKLYFERVGCAKNFKNVFFTKPFNKIGRSRAIDICFTNIAITVSREQSTIEFKNGRMYISNLSRTNPTFLNNDKIIRETEVVEGDLIGFGSKPNGQYPNFKDEEIFIFKCKSQECNEKSDAVVLILSDEDDDSDVEIVSPIKLDNNSNETRNVQQDQVKKILHFDTVESLKDKSSKERSSSLIENFKLKTVRVSLKRLPQSEIRKWTRRKSEERIISQNISEHFRIFKAHSSRNNYYEISKKLTSIVDPESDEEYTSIPISPSLSNFKRRRASCHEINETIQSIEIPKTSNAIKKRRMSVCASTIKSTPSLGMRATKTKRKRRKTISGQRIREWDMFDVANQMRSQRFTEKPKLITPQTDVQNRNPVEAVGSEIQKESEDKISSESKSTEKEMGRKNSENDKNNSISNNGSAEKKEEQKKLSRPKVKITENTRGNCLTQEFLKQTKDPPPRRMSKLVENTPLKKKITISAFHGKYVKAVQDQNTQSINACDSISDTINKQIFQNIEKLSLELNSNNNENEGKQDLPSSLIDLENKEAKLGVCTQIDSQIKNDPRGKTKWMKGKEVQTLEKRKESFTKTTSNIFDPTELKSIHNSSIIHHTGHKNSENDKNNSISNDGSAEKKEEQKKGPRPKVKITENTRGNCLTQEFLKQPKYPPPRRMSKPVENPPLNKNITISAFHEKYVKAVQDQNTQSINALDSISDAITTQIFQNNAKLSVETNSNNNENEDKTEVRFYTQNDSQIKNDPRGKTVWMKGKEIQTIEKRLELESFPTTSNILVHHTNIPTELKSIYKSSNVRQRGRKKSVSFNDQKLEDVRYIPSIEQNQHSVNYNQQVAHVQPMRTSTMIHPKIFESSVCLEILKWNTDWLHLSPTSLPEGFELEPIKYIYQNLDEYKKAIKKATLVVLLRKLTNCYKSRIKSNDWIFLTVLKQKYESNGELKLVLSYESSDVIRQSTMLLLKVRNVTDPSQRREDLHFFGYVTAVNDKQELAVSAFGKHFPKETAVVKSLALMEVQDELKYLSVLNCLQETPLMNLFINPKKNLIDRYNRMSTEINIFVDIDSRYREPNQHVIMKKLLDEVTRDVERIFFINGSTKSGKTNIMLSTVLNVILNSKEKKRILICTPTINGIDKIAETLVSRSAEASLLKISRVGFCEQLTGMSKKLAINHQVQKKIQNGARGNEHEIKKEILDGADIILTTCRASYDLLDFNLSFDMCFVDEANFCKDLELLIPMQFKIQKLILVGDEYQLIPIKSPITLNENSFVNFFNRMIGYYKSTLSCNVPVYTLRSSPL